MPRSQVKVNQSTLRCYFAKSCSCGHNFIGEERIVKMKIKLHHKVCDGVISNGNLEEIRKSFQSAGVKTSNCKISSDDSFGGKLLDKWLDKNNLNFVKLDK